MYRCSFSNVRFSFSSLRIYRATVVYVIGICLPAFSVLSGTTFRKKLYLFFRIENAYNTKKAGAQIPPTGHHLSTGYWMLQTTEVSDPQYCSALQAVLLVAGALYLRSMT